LQGVTAEDAQNPSADRGLGWKEPPVAGLQRRGLSITDSLTGAGRLDWSKIGELEICICWGDIYWIQMSPHNLKFSDLAQILGYYGLGQD
jgi:hypothetical protein